METGTLASAVQHWQTVERKPFYHVRPGLPTLTLAAPGCSFRCDFCLNAALSQYGRVPGVGWSATPLDPTATVALAVERALGEAGRRTDCPGCGSTLIERDLWRLRADHSRAGHCPGCGRRLAGLWGPP